MRSEEIIIPNQTLFDLFTKAKEKILWPKLTYINKDINSKIVIYPAGAKSRYQGALMVTDGKAYGTNKYFGRIQKKTNGVDSVFITAYDLYSLPGIKDLVVEILKNPVENAKLQGLQYSFCCFCGTMLTSKNSLAVGYGPICAGNYGLPWEGMAEAKDMENL